MNKIITLFIFGLFCCTNMHAIDVKSLIFGVACFSQSDGTVASVINHDSVGKISPCLRGNFHQQARVKLIDDDQTEKMIIECKERLKKLSNSDSIEEFIGCAHLLAQFRINN